MIEIIKFIGAVIAALLTFAVAIFYILPLLFLGVKAAFFDLKKSIYESKVAKKNWEMHMQNRAPNSELSIANKKIAELEKQLKEQTNEIQSYCNSTSNIENDKLKNLSLDKIKKRLLLCETTLYLYKIPYNITEYYDALVETGKKHYNLYRSEEADDRQKKAMRDYHDIINRIQSIEITHKNGYNLLAFITTAANDNKTYSTTLTSCSCNDFKFNLKERSACKHMFALAYHTKVMRSYAYFHNPTKPMPRAKCWTFMFED